MSPHLLLVVYCTLILLSSLAGGWIPHVVRLTHRRMEIALSFVSGVMLGIAVLHLLPHALADTHASEAAGHAAGHAHGHAHGDSGAVLRWLLGGFLAMFFIERFFCFHHHDAPVGGNGSEAGDGTCGHDPGHRHALAWSGAAVGLTLHTLIAGVALAASVESHEHLGGTATLAGLSTFLVIFLHKPFDALTIGTLMAAGRHSARSRHLVNLLFSLAIPLGAVFFYLGLGVAGESSPRVVSAALAFSAGTFLCISLSDVLPELQFHRHDRFKLSLALLLGIALSWGISIFEG